MAAFNSILLLLAAAVCAINANRIVGGEPTTIEQYPSAVQIESRTVLLWSLHCGANILTSRYLVSAAHCFLTSLRARRARIGSSYRGSGGEIYLIRDWITHPSYNLLYNDADITIVRLETAVVYSPQIQPVSILPQDFALPDGTPLVIAGWGTTSDGGSASSVLRDVTVFKINQQLCADRYRPVFGDSISQYMFCAGILDVGGKDGCAGDSGGPVYVDGILAGLVSWGQGCGDPFYPGVHVNIAAFTDWIVRTAV